MEDKLAKLLATENLNVIRSAEAKTAAFDLVSRTLMLPIWRNASKDVIDMMTGHEVGHALWTPLDKWTTAAKTVNKDILNICEDPRIDRKIKQKYPGLKSCYYNGYRDLIKRGFFGDLEDLDEMNLLDRLNVYFKGGVNLNIPFNEEEKYFCNAIENTRTFEDVIQVASELEEYLNSEQEQEEEDSESEFEQEIHSDEENTEKKPIVSETQEEFDSRVQEELLSDYENERVYISLPTPILSNIVISWKSILKDCEARVADKSLPKIPYSYVESSRSEFRRFRTTSARIINYMAKEFERRKAAEDYKKISIANTGVLNVNKLHAYKYADDLFLRRAVIAEGKNHGLVFLLDWSGSMHGIMQETIKQLFSLVWFCRRVNIPFTVYAFTSAYQDGRRMAIGTEESFAPCYVAPQWTSKNGNVIHDSRNHLLNFLNSNMSNREMTTMMEHIYIALSEPNYNGIFRGKYQLASTPTVFAMNVLQEIIPRFKESHNLSKVNFICLTDGQPNDRWSHVLDDYSESGQKYLLNCEEWFIDPMTGKEYEVTKKRSYGSAYYRGAIEQSSFLVNLLKDRYDVNTIGIYVTEKRPTPKELGRFIGWSKMHPKAHEKARKEIRNKGFCTVATHGYDQYHIVPLSNVEILDNTNLPENDYSEISNAKLKTLFLKNQKRKIGNRVLANQMLDLIV